MRINEGTSIAPAWAPGRYYFVPNTTSVTTSAVLGNGSLRAVPFFVPSPILLTRIGAEVATIGEAGSKFRLGIYTDDGSGRPGNLIVDAGQINGDSATVQELTISVGLGPGWYWSGGAVQSAPTTQPTMRATSNASFGVLLFVGQTPPAANSTVTGYQMTGVPGALPSAFVINTTAGVVPRIFVKT